MAQMMGMPPSYGQQQQTLLQMLQAQHQHNQWMQQSGGAMPGGTSSGYASQAGGVLPHMQPPQLSQQAQTLQQQLLLQQQQQQQQQQMGGGPSLTQPGQANRTPDGFGPPAGAAAGGSPPKGPDGFGPPGGLPSFPPMPPASGVQQSTGWSAPAPPSGDEHPAFQTRDWGTSPVKLALAQVPAPVKVPAPAQVPVVVAPPSAPPGAPPGAAATAPQGGLHRLGSMNYEGWAPTLEELRRDRDAGHTGHVCQDSEVKVLDPTGRPLAQSDHARYPTFEAAPFPQSIQSALQKAGFPAPSQVQQYCWPLGLQNRDMIGVAATGSGKTLAFLLPAFTYILERQVSARDPTLLVIAPTRELAVQIQEEADKFGRPSHIRTVCCYGGAPKGPQAREISAGVHGVIGTPGRINDFLEGNQLRLDRVVKLVLDEADRMLDMGFEPQIRKVVATIPRQRNTLFFTATWPPSVRRLASEFLYHPFTVTIGNRDELKGNQDIIQQVITCQPHSKNSVLLDLLRKAGVADRSNAQAKGLVFCSTKRMCDQLAHHLDRSSVPASAIHGDKDQRSREAALNGLKEGRIKLLVATDVAARGIDIKGVTLVVNYDAPANTEDYVHRIGRTGRAGQKGHAVTLIIPKEAHALRGIIQVMKRTKQVITPELEKVASDAGPAPPPVRRGHRGSDGGKGFGSSFGSSFGGGSGGGSASFVPGLSSGAGFPASHSGGFPMGGGMGGRGMPDRGRDRSRGGHRDRDRDHGRDRSRRRSRSRRHRSRSHRHSHKRSHDRSGSKGHKRQRVSSSSSSSSPSM